MRGRASIGQEVAIGFVEDQPGAVGAADFVDAGEKLRRIDRAGRIVRRHQRKSANARPQCRCDRVHLRQEAVTGIAGHQLDIDAEHRQRRFLVEVIGVGHQDRIAGRGDRHRGRDEGLVAAGRDVDVVGGDGGTIEPRHMRGIGLAQHRFAFDRAIAGIGGRRRRFAEPGQHVRVCRIAGHGLRQVDQRPAGAIIAFRPGEHRRHGRRRELFDERIEMRHGRCSYGSGFVLAFLWAFRAPAAGRS
ncbi:hypothetical protein D3C87_1458350 [compost metagenome]